MPDQQLDMQDLEQSGNESVFARRLHHKNAKMEEIH